MKVETVMIVLLERILVVVVWLGEVLTRIRRIRMIWMIRSTIIGWWRWRVVTWAMIGVRRRIKLPMIRRRSMITWSMIGGRMRIILTMRRMSMVSRRRRMEILAMTGRNTVIIRLLLTSFMLRLNDLI